MSKKKVKQQTACKAVPVAPHDVAWFLVGEMVLGRGAVLRVKPLYAVRYAHPALVQHSVELVVYRCRRNGSKLVTAWLIYADVADLPCSVYTSEMQHEDAKLYAAEFPSEHTDD